MNIPKQTNMFQGLNIRFISYLSTTGYSKSAQDWMYFLTSNGANLTFKSLHTLPLNDPSPKWQLAQSLLDKDLDYNIVIIYAVPHNMEKAIRHERRKNRHVKIYGFALWEADPLPKQWVSILNSLDYLIVHSQWNKDVFSKDVKIPIYVLYQPFDYQSKFLKQNLYNERIFQNIKADDYVFYTIGEWNGRKNIETLIQSYLKTFKNTDKVVLFIKTFMFDHDPGNVHALHNFVSSLINQHQNPPKITLNTERWTDDQINQLHTIGDCFVSTCRSEGIGLGACNAGILGKRVIITGYGAQVEYLKDAEFINYKVVPADDCHWKPADHSRCKANVCRHNPAYDKSYQKWADPDAEHFCQLLKKVYEEKTIKQTTAEYMKKNFNLVNIMTQLNSIIRTNYTPSSIEKQK